MPPVRQSPISYVQAHVQADHHSVQVASQQLDPVIAYSCMCNLASVFTCAAHVVLSLVGPEVPEQLQSRAVVVPLHPV